MHILVVVEEGNLEGHSAREDNHHRMPDPAEVRSAEEDSRHQMAGPAEVGTAEEGSHRPMQVPVEVVLAEAVRALGSTHHRQHPKVVLEEGVLEEDRTLQEVRSRGLAGVAAHSSPTEEGRNMAPEQGTGMVRVQSWRR